MTTLPRALIVEGDPDHLSALSAIVTEDGFTVDTADSLAAARSRLALAQPDIILIDERLRDGSGFELLQSLPERPGKPPAIMLSTHATVESAIEGLRYGIWDYLVKPVNVPRLRGLLARVPRTDVLIEEIAALRANLRQLGRYGALIGRSPAMQTVYDRLEREAGLETPVLLHGEPGTGKAMAARTLHERSRRSRGPFVRFNCAEAVRSTRNIETHGAALISMLFGREPVWPVNPNPTPAASAQTAMARVSSFGETGGQPHGLSSPGLERRRPGVFEQANGGTLYLDEITELPLLVQGLLLEALDARQYMRTNGSKPVAGNVRVLLGSRFAPDTARANGLLHEAWARRLETASVLLPPLRERGDDVVLIAEALVDALNTDASVPGMSDKRIAPAFVDECLAHAWPGNVSELRDRVQAAHAAAPGNVLENLEDGAGARQAAGRLEIRVGTPLAEVEDVLIRATLDAVGGTRHRAASMLGISAKTLYNKLQRMKDVDD